ncbi:putative gustatory receptor 28b isoform X3 [Drosophila ficusphila]|uniref:putative gustatory receptor 28b isoform X3 n=1 Tax=Drosophila ficusphila TaxID=30025 RepID=UPI0007E71C0B|nr:putative gustatory receptor 28b isoform X3 [Drosophila ficusphila]
MWLFRRLVGKSGNRPHDVYTCYRLTIFMALWLGIVPYYVTTSLEGRGKLRSSYIGFINIILRMIVYIGNFVYSLIERNSLMSNFFLTDISNTISGMQKVNGMLGIFFILLVSLMKRGELLEILTTFHRLETEEFPKVGVAMHQIPASRKMNRLVMTLVGSMVAYISCSFLIISLKDSATFSISAMISYFSPHFIVCAVSFLAGTLMIKLRIYLSALNEVLKNLAHQWDTRALKAVTQKQRSLQCLDSFSMYTIVTKDPAEIIHESMEIHFLICEAAATANKYFTYQLLTIISIAFLIIVFDAYYVLETLLGKSKRESKFKTVEFVTFFSCQMILYLIAIISIVEGSNRAIKKSEKTGGIVHSLLNKTKSAEVKEKLQQFSMQLMHLKINFTAAGLFNIDRTLYFTISGALTTYLIILLQFTSNSPNNGYGNGSSCCEMYNNLTNSTV